MSFERLTKGDALAWLSSLALLLITAVDWYSTLLGNAAREVQHDVSVPGGPLGGDIPSTVKEQAKLVAQAQEKNLWQVPGTIDRVILIVLLATAICASIAAVLRVASYRYEGTWTPSFVTALLAAIGAALVLYRIVQQPGDDQVTTLKAGPWLALGALGLICVGASRAWAAERDGSAYKGQPEPEPEPATPEPGPA